MIRIYLDFENTETGTIETGIVLGEYKTPDSAGKDYEKIWEGLRFIFCQSTINYRLDMARYNKALKGEKIILTKKSKNFGQCAED